MSEIVSVYAVFGSDEEARRIGRDMVEQGLAACVNIFGACHSIYRWQGRIEETEEVAAVLKTAKERGADLIAAIGQAHSYDVPAIVMLQIADGNEPYLHWVRDETRRDETDGHS